MLAVVSACSAAPARPTSPWAPELEGVDVFGSTQIDRDRLLARWGGELTRIVRNVDAAPDAVPADKQDLEAKLRAVPGIAYAQVSIVTSFEPKRTFVTVDLVDEADRARRMAFSPAPSGTHDDPDGLIALWDEYEATVTTLLVEGKVSPTTTECPFWHCISFEHASLARYQDAFATRVPAAADALASILRDDADEERRGSAAFLLAHLPSGPRVVELEAPAIYDSSDLVRNNAMRVLSEIALRHPELPIPLAPVLAALWFPATTDRNKALLILDAIARHADDQTKRAIRTTSGDVLAQLAAMRWPTIAETARSVLGQVQGADREN